MSPICPDFSHAGNKENGCYADIDWDRIGFGVRPTDFMYVMKSKDDGFTEGQLVPYGNIEINPAAGVLNYGQGLFEGLKAFRQEDGRIVLFRPEQNALRMKQGAERMCMPAPSVDQFVDSVKQVALANKRWIPPAGKGTLYIRPLLLGTGPILGLSPAPEYTFMIYTSPVQNYFKAGSSPLNLYVEFDYYRASRGGAGGVKSITNYAPVLKPLTKAKSKGYSDVLYLDSVSRKYVEEVSLDNVISTPPIKGTILPGVTRKSIIEIAREHGYEVEERLIEIDELVEADEAFCTGTAVVVVPVGSITYLGKKFEYQIDNNSVYKKLFSEYMAILNGQTDDKNGWIVDLC